jgi:signal transduction histidine kinase/HAMP domain-containing protein
MRRLVPRTFFVQLVLGIILAQTLALGGYLYYVVVTTRQVSRKNLETRISSQIDRLAAACTERIRRGDYETLRELLELAEIAPSIQSTRLTDLNGNTLAASKGGTNRGLDAEELKVLPTVTGQHIFRTKKDQVEAVTPLLEDGKPVALLWLEPNPASGTSTISSIVRIALTYGALALLANLLPIFLIVRRMTKPIRRLSLATHRVLRGTLPNPEFPLPVTVQNEAGVLTDNFNTMVRELEEQRSGLLDTLALLDSMLGNAPIGFAFLNAEFRIIRQNDFFSVMFNTQDADGGVLAGSLAAEVEARVAEVFRTGQGIRNLELQGGREDSPRAWLMQFYPVRTSSENVRWVGVVGSEITERLKAEETLRRTEKLAAAGRLAASVAHEINNPLESVTNLLYILRNHQPMDGGALGFIEMAQEELARVAQVTQQTLRFYRQSVSRARVDLDEIVDSVFALYQPRLLRAKINVLRKSRGDTSLVCFAGEMRQLMANLVANSLDAMPNGGTLSIRMRRTSIPSGGVLLTVADTGHGMSAETARKVFEAFFTTKHATGTGLGLWVSEEIIRKHRGLVRLRTRQGERSGTCFFMFFPDVSKEAWTDVEADGQMLSR